MSFLPPPFGPMFWAASIGGGRNAVSSPGSFCWKIDSVGFFLLWVICDTSRAKLRRCGNLHLWRYPWTSRQEMVHSNEWSETVQIRSYITLYNIMCISTNIRRPLGKGERAWELWCQMRSNGASNLWIAWFGHETCWGSRSAKGFGSPFSS